jgi:hypothetical protein
MRGAFLTAEWRHVAMLNYEVDGSVLMPLVPRGTELDAWQRRTYMSVVGFLFLGTRVRGLPIAFRRDCEGEPPLLWSAPDAGGQRSALASAPGPSPLSWRTVPRWSYPKGLVD